MPKNYKLAYPPGIMRNGTKYQAQGRWYDANLVRWYEGVMRPWDGWQRKEHTNDKAVSAAIADDGGAFTDYTTAANNATANDVVLLPATPAQNDAFYVGYSHVFNEVRFNIGTAATDGVLTFEYYNGSTWVALTVTDLTDNFKNAGSNSVTWTAPRDWAKTTINSQGPFYYIRARVSTAGASQPLGTQLFIVRAPIQLDEAIRNMLAWRDNTGSSYLAMATASYIYALSEGVLTDITPSSGFTTGQEHATSTSGNYGAGAYGSGPYGVGDASLSAITEATTWALDSWGEYLVGCSFADGKLRVWDLNVANNFDVMHADAPTGCVGLVVTPERFVVALGVNGVPGSYNQDGRGLVWCDQEDYATWTPSSANQAGDWTLATQGEIMGARAARNETLIWTTVDLWAMRYIGGTLVYSFHRAGDKCGAISRHSMVAVDAGAIWMGHRGFFKYDGFVSPIPCEVSDYVFGDMNRTQASKITAHTISEFGEIIWYYPSAEATYNDRYVVYNYRENTWSFGSLERCAGVDRGAFPNYISSDEDGSIYDHEVGASFLDPDDTELTAYAEGGPLELADGDNVVSVMELIPDDKTLGDVQATFYHAFYPDASETTDGPHTLANRTDLRFTCRQVRMRVTQVNAGWRVGIPRLAVEVGGRR